jgi:hypothetical protein
MTSEQANYEICLIGHLDEDWGHWFEGLAMKTEFSQDGEPITKLSGPIKDQAALHGILARIRNLGIPILSLNRINPEGKGIQYPCK